MRYLPVLLTAFLALAVVTNCDWYRQFRVNSVVESAKSKVDGWRDELDLPTSPGTDDTGAMPELELLVGPDSIRLHNMRLLGRLIYEHDATDWRPERVRARLALHSDLDFDTDDKEGLGNEKLQDTLRKVAHDARKMLKWRGQKEQIEILFTIDRQVSYRKITEIFYSAGQAGLSRYEVLVRSPDGTNTSNSPRFSRFGIDAPSLCATPQDENTPPPCAQPTLARHADGVVLRFSPSVDWTPDRHCMTAKTVTAADMAEIGESGDSDNSSDSNGSKRDYSQLTDRPIQSPDGQCPIPTDDNTKHVIETLEAIHATADLCNHATVTAANDTRWGDVAPLIPTIQRHTRIKLTALSIPSETALNCKNAVAPSDI